MAGENGESQEQTTAEETVSQAHKLGEELLASIGEHVDTLKNVSISFAEKSMDVGAAVIKKAKENPRTTAAVLLGLVALGVAAVKISSSSDKKEETE
jgi:hypothetical protein